MSAPTSIVAEVSWRAARWRKRLFDLGWAAYGVGTISLGGLMVAAGALSLPTPLPEPAALVFAALGLCTYLWPIAMVAGLFVGRERKLGRTEVERNASGALALRGASGSLEVPASSASQGTVVGGALVLEDESGREIRIETAEAGKLLDAIDLEPAQRRFRFHWRRTRHRVWSFIGTMFAMSFLASAPVVLASHGSEPSIAALGCMLMSSPWLVAELVSRWYANRELTVGLDGVSSTSRLGRGMIRFADVERIETGSTALVFVMKDGSRCEVLADPDDPALRTAIEHRVREAFALAQKRAGQGAGAAALLERAGRTLGEWRAAVARVLTASTGFRDAAVTPDELGAVLDDVTASAEQRLAAAIALGQREDPAVRARIRVAAEASASPKLRVALEGLADGDASDAALEDALASERAATR